MSAQNVFTGEDVLASMDEIPSDESELDFSESDASGESESDVSESEEEYQCPSADGQLSSSEEENLDSEEDDLTDDANQAIPTPSSCIWSTVTDNFQPRIQLTPDRIPEIHPDLKHTSKPLDIFLKLFLYSLFIQISNFTNKRLKIYEKAKRKKIAPTSPSEVMQLFGCFFIMSYCRLPSIAHYWSKHPSMGNLFIKKAFSRDRFQLLMSKLYFNEPEKPASASKTYYTDELLSCLKYTFQKYRKDSPFQSIDESMTKFKGRCSFKQYLPMKPVKRGVKMWMRCDAKSGYVYDVNIYTGKEETCANGTLGERIVTKLALTINDKDVTLAFDRFFTSVNLLDTIAFPAVGTCIKSRKNVPVFKQKLKRGESEFFANTNGTLAVKWMDTKDVILFSNCHTHGVQEVMKKQKDGTRVAVPCPEAIRFYRSCMGGVDRADQMAGVYELDRKSLKWWKKVLYRMLNFAAVNSWVIFKQLQRDGSRTPFLSFLVELAETLV